MQRSRRVGGRKSGTNLSLAEYWEEKTRDAAAGSPRSEKEERTDSIKGRRFDKYGDDSLVHSARAFRRSHDISNVPAMQDEPYHDHDCEEDVEREGKRKV